MLFIIIEYYILSFAIIFAAVRAIYLKLVKCLSTMARGLPQGANVSPWRALARLVPCSFSGFVASHVPSRALMYWDFWLRSTTNVLVLDAKVVVDAYDDDHRGIALRSWLGSSDDQRHMCLLEGARGKST